MALDIFDELARDMWNITRESLEPLIYVTETDDTIVVEVDLPLVKKKDIRLRLVENGLEVEATLTRCVKFERWGTVQKSCEFKSLYKVIPLTRPVNAEGTKASFKKGILRIELKKRKEAEYRIPIE